MKFERFIATFVMMNIVILMCVVFTGKNHLIMQTVGKLLYAETVDGAYFDLSPDELRAKGYENDDTAETDETMQEIYDNTSISRDQIEAVKVMEPYDAAVSIVQMFSLMGDGTCHQELSIAEKINAAAKKEGCAKDFAIIFLALANDAEIPARIVSNGNHYANEIYDGRQWVYIDPYFAMSVSSAEGLMSFRQFAAAMVDNGWMRFNFFGGEEHCMSGKQAADHPYYGDPSPFAQISFINGNNAQLIAEMDAKYGARAAFIKYISPYKNGMPKDIILNIKEGTDKIIERYVLVLIALFAAIFLGTNVLLPGYYILGLFGRKK